MSFTVATRSYRLEVRDNGLFANVTSPTGDHWLSIRPLAAIDTFDGADETLAVEPARAVDERTVVVARQSTLWERSSVTIVCGDDALDVRTSVTGRGRLAVAQLLAARSLVAGQPTGFLPSGASFRTLFSPNPGDPGRLVRGAAEPAVIGVFGDGNPGRGHWFFTPAPLYFALTPADGIVDPLQIVPGGWVGLGLAAPIDELTFGELAYRPADRGFSLALDYDGHTDVDGDFELPAIVISPAVDPYAGLRRHRDELSKRGAAPPVRPRPSAAWWNEPIFCGWGGQCALAREEGVPASSLATQATYDTFLATLERERVVPGTVVVDDKWQESYGTNLPDTAKWPDLPGWIAARHERRQRVLLWWKAWDPEGVPAELCVRTPDGRPVALDPTHPAARDLIREMTTRMLRSDGLDADGLKIDFTARTPSGQSLVLHGQGWGIALLHEFLALVYEAAKEAKPDALLITQTPHPAFADVADMIRLNDMLRLDDGEPFPSVVPQMQYRAEVVRAVCPELPIDTDDWCVPSLAEWRAYLEAKQLLGVPALYYADTLDWTGERLEASDYEALRGVWSAWRAEKMAS
jgi:hypothetical protein